MSKKWGRGCGEVEEGRPWGREEWREKKSINFTFFL